MSIKINWKTSKIERELIEKIAIRALGELGLDISTIKMDVTACHKNGCHLDLESLLNAPRYDFVHDICGINRHIDRETGKLQHCFLPRLSRKRLKIGRAA